MKYVIKDINTKRYVNEINDVTYWFTLTDNIDEAKKFTSLFDAINQIVYRAAKNTGFGLYYTIVGIKEVSTPRYEEVLL